MKTGDKVTIIGLAGVHAIDNIIPDWYTQQLDIGLFKLSNDKYYRRDEIKPHTPRSAPIWRPMYRQSPPVMARPRYGR